MKVVNHSYVMRIAPWAVPVLTLGIFLFDVITPVGVAVSVLYVLPLLLTFLSTRERDPLNFSLIATGFIWLDLLLKPPGISIPYGVFNRALGMVVLWGVTLGLMRYKRLQQGLRSAETARAEAVVRREAAVAARELADVSAKGASEALRERERVHRTLLANLSGMAYRCRNDKDWTMEFVSDGCEDLAGYTAEDLIENRRIAFNTLIHENDRQRIWDECQISLAARRPCSTEYRIITRTGEEKWVWDQAQGIYEEGGRLAAIEGFIADITERKRAQEQFELAVEASPNGMLMVDEAGRIVMINHQVEQLFGYEREELIGQSVDILVPKHVRSTHAGDREAFMAHSEARAMGQGRDLYGVGKDGREFPLEIGLNPIRTKQGTWVLASVVDISERKRTQEQLRKAERLAELGTLASGMAHEIGTPMNVILGRAEYLMDRVKEEPIKKGLQTIVAQVERITRVMNQLLSFARRKPPERGPLVLQQVIDNNLEMFQERLARNRVHVERLVDPGCPKVLADADQMSQVVINLVMNAIHAMPDGGTLRVGLEADKEMVKLTVGDTGHGIPQEAIKKIFEPFFTTKEFGKGTGLGLTVVKGIIEEHHGTIAVESEESKGTTFTIQLPVASSS